MIRYTLTSIALIFLLSKQICAQEYSRTGYVLAEPTLNVRNTPNSDGEIISQIPYATEVKVWSDIRHYTDSINGEIYKWLPIDYNNEIAYVWGKYITFNQNLVLDYGLLSIGQDGSKYNPDLNWYGIFESDSNGFNQIKQIDISLVELDDEYYGRLSNVVNINLKERPIFLFGTRNLLDEQLIAGNVLRAKYNKEGGQEDYERQKHESFLYPEEIMKLQMNNSRNQLQIKAKDAPYIDSTHNYIYTRYELEVTTESFYSHGKTNTQNITSEIPFIDAPAFRCAVYINPRIYWYGDIDFDQKIDFVISTRMMADTDGVEGSLLLFLSSQANEGDFVKMVAKTNSEY